jgi:hypothetical protein
MTARVPQIYVGNKLELSGFICCQHLSNFYFLYILSTVVGRKALPKAPAFGAHPRLFMIYSAYTKQRAKNAL